MPQIATEEIQDNVLITKIDTIAKEMGQSLPPPTDALKMVITIPAKNESESIIKTLEAISNQKLCDRKPFNSSRFELLVLCNNCSDDTYVKCNQFSAKYTAINVHCMELNSDELNTVGAARRILMNIASGRLSENGFIITTDADTIPDSNWLATIESYSETNIGLVCGFIRSDYESVDGQALKYLQAKDEYLMLKSELEHKLLPNLNDPWPRHSYHWGPNLAIKNNVYNAVGGIQPLHFLEDVDLYNRVVSLGIAVRHCMDTIVTTSTRIDSRCGEGFGAELKIWSEWEGVSYNVEGLQKLLMRFKIHTLLNQFYSVPNIELFEPICEIAETNKESLLRLIHTYKNPEAALIAIQHFLDSNQDFHERFPNCSVFGACEDIRNYLLN
ncbi:MAG: glycosyltransferase [Aquaticitalea sp.]